jgi:predicted nucleic acid-binding protein
MTAMPVIVDTGAVVAMFNRRDPSHDAVVRVLGRERSAVHIPQSVIIEAGWLIGQRRSTDRIATLVSGIASSTWRTECLSEQDLARSAEILTSYADSRIDLVDASVVAVAERLRATRIYTLDQRDFSIIRPRHVEAFELLP